jgi:hypothetical protein
LRIDPSEKIKVMVPVEFRGECPGSEKLVGSSSRLFENLRLNVLLKPWPEVAVAHLAHLEAGNVLKIKHLELPQGARATSDGEAVVASCLLTQSKA